MRRFIESPSLAGVVAIAIGLAACQGSGDGSATADSPAAAPAAEPAPSGASSGALRDPNTITREEFMAIPGADSVATAAFLAGRPYANNLAVDAALAPHMTEAERDSVYARVWIPIDLNTATGPEIMLIPGVGDNMRHEFEEYRPYTAMAQFRREMAKYVHDSTITRYEKYVTIRPSGT